MWGLVNKSNLIKFINRYHLGGSVEAVAWVVDGDLSIKFHSDDKSMVGDISMTDFKLPPVTFGVYNTTLLLKMLGATGDDVELDIESQQGTAVALIVSDESTTMKHALADLMVIPKAAQFKRTPQFELEIDITRELIDKIVKATAALPDVDVFVIGKNKKNNAYQISIGQSTANGNKVSINVNAIHTMNPEGEAYGDIDPMSFSSQYLKKILMANKDMTIGLMSVSSDGLVRLYFAVEGCSITYYLPALNA